MYVDSNNNIVVRSRSLVGSSADLVLYAGDFHGRDNISSISNFNTGLQRMFNIVKVNDTTKKQANYISVFESRQKDFIFDFITNGTKENTIGTAILDELKAPKIELELSTDTETANGLELYDQIRVIVKPKYKPASGKLPMYGSFLYGEKVYPFETIGSKIDETAGFKVVGISENPAEYITTLKLRQFGISVSDGHY